MYRSQLRDLGARVILCVSIVAAIICAAVGAQSSAAQAQPAPIPIRVVVVTTFEVGADTGDRPGEFQYWVERFPLPATFAFPQGYRALRYNAQSGVLGIVTGEGAERGAASIMALGLDPRFDLAHAYWVVAAIAGVDPQAASVGSAAWANWVVNADLGFEIDPRDTPANWPTGIVPFDRVQPYGQPAPPPASIHGVAAYRLNAGLAGWAYARTVATPLTDTPNLRSIRAAYAAFPNAQKPPFVLRGDSLCGDRYFVGAAMTAWAERWVPYWTGGAGTFAMTAEEDAGIMQALTFLAGAERVDPQRVLVLRTASDFSEPGAGSDAATLLAHDAGAGGESAYLEALDAAYRIGSPVVSELSAHWDRYGMTVPSMP
jgi:purine nucleoside permease